MYKTIEDSKRAYEEYILQHKQNVKDAWNYLQIEFPNYPFVTDKYINYYITKLVDKHDDSKYEDIEFEPYRKFFYPTAEDTNKDIIQKEYDKAWVHHYSNNPHHWEYWVEFDKNKERECLRFIREAFLIERICDWMAMSKYNHNKVIDWYNDNIGTMYLPDDDRKFIEDIIFKLKNY